MKNFVDLEFDRIVKEGFDPINSSVYEKTIVMVTTAQGIIGNGGFQFFFENEFEDNPNMMDFAKAYMEIGMRSCATAIELAIRENELSKPCFDKLDDIMFQYASQVYDALESYVNKSM